MARSPLMMKYMRNVLDELCISNKRKRICNQSHVQIEARAVSPDLHHVGTHRHDGVGRVAPPACLQGRSIVDVGSWFLGGVTMTLYDVGLLMASRKSWREIRGVGQEHLGLSTERDGCGGSDVVYDSRFPVKAQARWKLQRSLELALISRPRQPLGAVETARASIAESCFGDMAARARSVGGSLIFPGSSTAPGPANYWALDLRTATAPTVNHWQLELPRRRQTGLQPGAVVHSIQVWPI